MRKITLTIGIFVIGMILFFVLYQYNRSVTFNTAVTKSLQITADAVFNANLDSSYRVTANEIGIIDAEQYEQDFASYFEQYATFNASSFEIEYNYSYLIVRPDGSSSEVAASEVTSEDKVKAITSTVTIDKREYTIHMIVDKED